MSEPLPRLPTPPSPLPRSHTETSRPKRSYDGSGNPTRSYSHSSTRDLSDWEIEELEQLHKSGGKRKKRKEPTSPIVVVFYVVVIYLIFQILTRSDDMEIFTHLPTTSSIHQSRSPPSSMDVPNYPHLPYGFPPIPNPMPSSLPPTNETSWTRLAFGVILYPFYLILTLIAIPLPLLLNLAYLLKGLLSSVILYPVLSVFGLFYRAFIATPLGFIGKILETFYPLVIFVGGVISVGCIMGLISGYLGKLVLDKVLSWKQSFSLRSRNKVKKKSKSEKERERIEELYKRYDAQLELEREMDRLKPKKPIFTSTPVLDIGSTNIRGTKKDEKQQRAKQLQLQRERQKIANTLYERETGRNKPTIDEYGFGFSPNDYEEFPNSRRKYSSTSSSSERLTTPTTTHFRSIDDPRHTITTFDTGEIKQRKPTSSSRKLTFEEDGRTTIRHEPIVVGMRKRGIRETYVI
ncbi:uncharacterized protein L201_000993 [Kwoniella dendrophila CBS 6074]|uniref:Golgi apparatus membrane protein TVP38 n=1 Tax=Kwoniella dendrophila CBS 6074 TaxID=1295534 RepID=A0AAX4JL33_9TREE